MLLFLVVICAPGCRNSAPAGPRAGSAATATTPLRSDPALDRLFARIAGLAVKPGTGEAAGEEAAWTAFAGRINAEWANFERTVLEPMKTWAAGELREARKATTSVFYPFGGPDLVTSFTLFPEARETVLIGLEPVGNLPDLDRESAAWREGFYTDLGDLIAGFLRRGYFITREMNDIYSRSKVDGALPVVAFFLAREGCAVAEVTRLVPDERGGWAETPYERLAARPHRPYGARIVYLKPGDPEAHSVVYFSGDVGNKAFPPDSPLYRYMAGLERMTTFVKSGSYLLHWNEFSILRDFILGGSRFVLEDDTAVPYRFFTEGGWTVKLFGRYGQPVSDFKNVEQTDLERAYEADGPSVAPLPFHFGYHWRTRVDNLLLAKRPRRPYKRPVLR